MQRRPDRAKRIAGALAGAVGDALGASATKVASLGQGWIAEGALAVGLYCALVARGFEDWVLLAVNHGGDSDSTGAIAGTLLGLMVGEQGIPASWLDELELREVTAGVADELYLCARGG